MRLRKLAWTRVWIGDKPGAIRRRRMAWSSGSTAVSQPKSYRSTLRITRILKLCYVGPTTPTTNADSMVDMSKSSRLTVVVVSLFLQSGQAIGDCLPFAQARPFEVEAMSPIYDPVDYGGRAASPQPASFRVSARSCPRGVRESVSSMTAACRSFAARRVGPDAGCPGLSSHGRPIAPASPAGEIGRVRRGLKFDKRLSHGVQAKRTQAFGRGMDQHAVEKREPE